MRFKAAFSRISRLTVAYTATVPHIPPAFTYYTRSSLPFAFFVLLYRRLRRRLLHCFSTCPVLPVLTACLRYYAGCHLRLGLHLPRFTYHQFCNTHRLKAVYLPSCLPAFSGSFFSSYWFPCHTAKHLRASPPPPTTHIQFCHELKKTHGLRSHSAHTLHLLRRYRVPAPPPYRYLTYHRHATLSVRDL